MQAFKKTFMFGVAILSLSFGLVLESVASEESERFLKTKALAEKGDVLEQVYLGTYYEEGNGVRQDYEKALYWYRKSANQNNSEGQLQLGILYYDGNGVRQDYKKAIYWYQKSANQNNSISQFRLGLMYQYGSGVKQNMIVAKEWYGKSCDHGAQIGCDSYRELNEQGY